MAVAWSCRTGVCHTCECGLVEGQVDYSADALEPPEERRALICCSQFTSDVAVEL